MPPQLIFFLYRHRQNKIVTRWGFETQTVYTYSNRHDSLLYISVHAHSAHTVCGNFSKKEIQLNFSNFKLKICMKTLCRCNTHEVLERIFFAATFKFCGIFSLILRLFQVSTNILVYLIIELTAAPFNRYFPIVY